MHGGKASGVIQISCARHMFVLGGSGVDLQKGERCVLYYLLSRRLSNIPADIAIWTMSSYPASAPSERWNWTSSHRTTSPANGIETYLAVTKASPPTYNLTSQGVYSSTSSQSFISRRTAPSVSADFRSTFDVTWLEPTERISSEAGPGSTLRRSARERWAPEPARTR